MTKFTKDEGPTYRELDRAWRSTCRIILGKEVGALKDFEGFLGKDNDLVKEAKSITGKAVHYTAPYKPESRFDSYEESFGKELGKPINTNQIKDIDSLIEAVGERISYTGNKILGNSKFIEESENIADCFNVLRSSEILRCEYIAYSCLLRDGKYMFGCNNQGIGSFSIRGCETVQSQRTFETGFVFYSSDAYYSYNCRSCSDIIFCFDQRNKRNMIGNNQLSADRFKAIKKHMVEQIADELTAKKRISSIVEVVSGG